MFKNTELRNNIGLSVALFAICVSSSSTADQQILDDLIVGGSICAGLDCVNGESFGFDTLRLKENNLRIKFQDTSTSASFPSSDWQLTANDSSNGGANKFSIDDISGGRTPFTIEATAPSNSLYVDDGGRVGFGTSTPVASLHAANGNTPTLRLEQDGSSGFTQQTWDLAGNEANFFIRDITNGNRLPFRIQPAAPSNSLYIASDGDVGMGTSSPGGDIHIRRTDSTPTLVILEQASASVIWEMKVNETTGRLTFKEQNSGTTPFKFAPSAVENLFRVGIDGDDIVDINGNLDISGNLTITGQCTEADGACADYVFQPDYELRSLEELESFIKENRHLPNVPSAKQMTENGVNIAHMSGRLLEKVEELTLYTLQQQRTISLMEQHNAELGKTITALNSRIDLIEIEQ